MRNRSRTALMLMVLYSMLIIALLVLTVAGAQLYGTAVREKSAHSERRSALSYIQSQADSFGNITLEDDNKVLCMAQTDGSYVTRIYMHDGALCAETSQQEQPIQPENSERICALEELRLEWLQDGVLKITADGRVGYVSCMGGGSYE